MSGQGRSGTIRRLLFNYWELHPKRMGVALDELLQDDISQISTFVPWQIFESDISHRLLHFLVAAAQREMHVCLIVTPEMGVNAVYSGIPKDILAKPENLAVTPNGDTVPVLMPPHVYCLPSIYSGDFNKRYLGYLSRLNTFLSDLGRGQYAASGILDRLSIGVTGSFWKYYRSSDGKLGEVAAGDYSQNGADLYRQALRRRFSDREYVDPENLSSNRWKTRVYDRVNRKWFASQSEELFRKQTAELICRNGLQVPVEQIDLSTPEADPSFLYSRYFQSLVGGAFHSGMFSSALEEASVAEVTFQGKACSPSVHWTSGGGFHTLPEAERQFLILKSILLMGAQSGQVYLDHRDWTGFSTSFRNKVELFSRACFHKKLSRRRSAIYFTPHLWSPRHMLFKKLYAELKEEVSQLSCFSALLDDREAELAVLDPYTVLDSQRIQQLVEWVKGGRVLAIPRTPFYTDLARETFEKILSDQKTMDLSVGVSHEVARMGNGYLVAYDLPLEGKSQIEVEEDWQRFSEALLALSQLEKYCQVGDRRLMTIRHTRSDGGEAVFILNGTDQSVSTDMIFPCEVEISNLMAVLNGEPIKKEGAHRTSRFKVDIPPFGVLPFAIDRPKKAERKNMPGLSRVDENYSEASQS